MTWKGFSFALAACMLWGLIFIIPPSLKGFAPLEIALGRHGVYGLISCSIFLLTGRKSIRKHPLHVYGKALLFSLICNIVYYSCVVMGTLYASPSITALILGTSPVLISFYGNWMKRECSFKSLIIPSLLILAGLVLINVPVFSDKEIALDKPFYLLGVIAAFTALIAWSWYVVVNSLFLKSNPTVSSQDWSTLIGVATFFWVLIVGGCYEGWLGEAGWSKFLEPSQSLAIFVAGCAVLGIFCSWIGAFLWNKASSILPVSLAGELTVFETIFGLLYFYLLEMRMPPMLELMGIALILSAILYGINAFALQTPPTELSGKLGSVK